MPYSVNDPNLPSNIRGLRATARRQWVAVYNSEVRLGKSEGDALRIANGVLRGERSVVDMPLEFTPTPVPVSVPVSVPESLDPSPRELRERGGNMGMVDDIMNFFRGGGGSDGDATSQFSLREMPDGRMRYYAIASNNYEDRGGLIFTEAGQRKYLEFVDRTGKYPELWLFHARGTRFGQADRIFWLEPHIQFTTGVIDVGKESLARKLAGMRDLGMSHGYVGKHVELPDGTVEVPEFVQFEQSVLPHKAAANFGTYFGLLGGVRDLEEGVPRFTQEQRDFLLSVGETPERVTEIEGMTNQMHEFFEHRGIDWRSLELSDGETPPAVAGAPAPAVVPGIEGTSPSGAGGPVTEDDVRRIVGEALAGSELTESVRSMAASVRALSEGADERFARQYEGRTRGLPGGFKASERGSAPNDSQRQDAAAGALKPPNPFGWTEDMFGMNPLLSGAGGNGRNS